MGADELLPDEAPETIRHPLDDGRDDLCALEHPIKGFEPVWKLEEHDEECIRPAAVCLEKNDATEARIVRPHSLRSASATFLPLSCWTKS
jgi:hypothetical protein